MRSHFPVWQIPKNQQVIHHFMFVNVAIFAFIAQILDLDTQVSLISSMHRLGHILGSNLQCFPALIRPYTFTFYQCQALLPHQAEDPAATAQQEPDHLAGLAPQL